MGFHDRLHILKVLPGQTFLLQEREIFRVSWLSGMEFSNEDISHSWIRNVWQFKPWAWPAVRLVLRITWSLWNRKFANQWLFSRCEVLRRSPFSWEPQVLRFSGSLKKRASEHNLIRRIHVLVFNISKGILLRDMTTGASCMTGFPNKQLLN